MGGLIALAVVAFLAVIPLGVHVSYDASGALVRVIAGPIKITVFPQTQKNKKQKPKKQKNDSNPLSPSKTAKVPQSPASSSKSGAEKKVGGSLVDFLPLVKLAFAFLGDFRRKLRLNNLYLRVILAADDPCDLAVNYGRSWAAVGNLLPRLEKLFVIKKRDIEVECDFQSTDTLIIARLDVTITLGRLLALVFGYAIRALVQFLKIKKKRKGGAQIESETS